MAPRKRHEVATPEQPNRLGERAVKDGGDESAMNVAHPCLQRARRILIDRAQSQVGAQFGRGFELVLMHIHRHDVQAHCIGVLYGHVVQPADALDRAPVAGFRLQFLEPVVARDARAKDGRGGIELQIAGQTAHVIGLALDALGIAVVHRVSLHLLAFAEGFPTADAVDKAPAGGVEPGSADAVALLQMGEGRGQRRPPRPRFGGRE